MTEVFDEPEGATPLDPSEQEGLIPTWIVTRSDLNAAEQENIAVATAWAFSRTWKTSDFDQRSLKGLHDRMFCDVWRWAGTYRARETNLGVAPYLIATQVEHLVRDLQAQTVDTLSLPWTPDEIAVRFHHRLVLIHPFPNGNGRHSRLVADLVVTTLGSDRFTWGAASHLVDVGPARQEYLEALRIADSDGDYSPLLLFARR